MKFNIGAMSFGDILDRGLKLTMARLPTFYVIFLIVMSPVILLNFVQPYLMSQLIKSEANPEAMLGFLVGFLGALLLVILVSLILSTIGNAAILHVISQGVYSQKGIGDF